MWVNLSSIISISYDTQYRGRIYIYFLHSSFTLSWKSKGTLCSEQQSVLITNDNILLAELRVAEELKHM